MGSGKVEIIASSPIPTATTATAARHHGRIVVVLMVWKHHDYPSILALIPKNLSFARYYQCSLNLGPASAAVSVGKLCPWICNSEIEALPLAKSAVVLVLIYNVQEFVRSKVCVSAVGDK
jgi:hypothetical protein